MKVRQSACPTLSDPLDCSPQAPLSIRFSRQEYWSELPFPSPGGLLNPRIEPKVSHFAGRFFTVSGTREALALLGVYIQLIQQRH